MLAQTLTGVQANADGSYPTIRSGKQGDLIVSELHGRYYESTYRGKMFSVASQAVATTTVGLATTYTGLVLSNPVNSGINLIVNKCTTMQSVIQSTQPEAYGLAAGFNATTNVTHTTPATPQSNLVGSGLSALAKADVSATLPTAPLYLAFAAQTASATVNGTAGIIDLEGSVILAPGAYLLWVTPAQASVAGIWFSFQWEEVAV